MAPRNLHFGGWCRNLTIFFLRKELCLPWNWLRAFCTVGYTPHATAFLHNEVGTFTDEWPQEWSYAIARASPRSRMKERERELDW